MPLTVRQTTRAFEDVVTVVLLRCVAVRLRIRVAAMFPTTITAPPFPSRHGTVSGQFSVTGRNDESHGTTQPYRPARHTPVTGLALQPRLHAVL